MAGRPKAPGWYPDPDILPGSHHVLRYWTGRHWTDKRRPMPLLAPLNLGAVGLAPIRPLEGPARTVELPALAGDITATRDSPAGLIEPRDRSTTSDVRGVELPAAPGGGGPPPKLPGLGGGGGGGDDGDGGADETAPSHTGAHRKWWFWSIVAVLAALAVILTGEALKQPSPGPRVLTDATFIRLANADCAKTLPTLRPVDGGEMPAAVTPADAAAQADKAATGLDALANQIATLPAAAADQPHIAGWLAGWHQYATIGHQFATDLRKTGGTGKEPPYLTTAAHLASASDKFSSANGLNNCLFAYAYQANPSDF
jgi:hypothetical protein